MASRHKCYRCEPAHEVDPGVIEPRELESLESTLAEGGESVFFASGYSAREIAQARAREIQGRVFVNDVSRKIRRPDLTVPVSYAVAQTPVYTVCGPDSFHDAPHRTYWRPLE